MFNMYEFEYVRREDGVRSNRDGKGVTVRVFAPDMVTAVTKARYQNKKNRWRSKPVLVDVQLNKHAFAHVGRKPGDPQDVTVWYSNNAVGLALRIQ